MRYSIFCLLRQTLARHRGWTPAWRDAAPKPGYDVIIVGGGGHGLATAYYLAKGSYATDFWHLLTESAAEFGFVRAAATG